jgi:hypothetical protein
MLEVIAVCNRCRRTVADGEGGLQVSWDEVQRARTFRLRSLKLLLSTGVMSLSAAEDWDDFIATQPTAKWRVYHYPCALPVRRGRYGFDVSEVRTRASLIAMTNHLCTKSWFIETDWLAVLHDAVKVRGPRLFLMPTAEELKAAIARRLEAV